MLLALLVSWPAREDPVSASPEVDDRLWEEEFPYRSERAGSGDVADASDLALIEPPTRVAEVVAAESTLELVEGDVVVSESVAAEPSPVTVRWLRAETDATATTPPPTTGEAEPPTDELGTAPSTEPAEPTIPSTLPASTESPSELTVSVVDEEIATRAGLQKVAFTVAPDDASAVAGDDRFEIVIDYSSFRESFGASWSSRIQLASFGACWLTAQPAAGCPAPVPVARQVNDLAGEKLVAEVDLSDVEVDLAERWVR